MATNDKPLSDWSHQEVQDFFNKLPNDLKKHVVCFNACDGKLLARFDKEDFMSTLKEAGEARAEALGRTLFYAVEDQKARTQQGTHILYIHYTTYLFSLELSYVTTHF